MAVAFDCGFVVELRQFLGAAIGFGAQCAGGGKAADGFVVLVEYFVGPSQRIVGISVGGVGDDGLFERDGGIAVGALLHQIVAGAIVVDGFRVLGQGRDADKRQREAEVAEVLQGKSPEWDIV